jgi:uncharacterized membrane protein YphA (DoxX/SURF4 family)
MQEILFQYKLNPTTWAYLSALMMIGMYFKFHRFWSVRNLDRRWSAFTTLLIYYGWLIRVSGFRVRLLIDRSWSAVLWVNLSVAV